MSIITKRLDAIKPSPTLAVTKRAAELKKKGLAIISMGAGEPDFDTPDNIKTAAITGIINGATKYTNVDGMPELKKAIVSKFKSENDISYELDEIIVSTGGKQVIYNLFMASINYGDEVIIPAPYWVSYSDIVLLAGGKTIFIECPMSQEFKLLPQQLVDSITDNTKWLVINSPNNPTGATYSKNELERIAEVLRKFPHVNILSDDIYEHVTFDGFQFYNLAQIAPDLKERIFIVNGLSKAYSMTGWRIGYGAGNRQLINAMTMIQSHSTSNASSISQIAGIEALSGTQEFIQPHKDLFQKKRDLAVQIINSSDGLQCYIPAGAFYLFPSCEKLFGLKTPSGNILSNSNDVANYFLEDAQVAVVPGIAFGMDGYFRISYAMSLKDLEDGCLRIKSSCAKLYAEA